MTLLSIIIPTINRSVIVKQTIENVCLSIEGINAEIIVVNDSKIELVIGMENIIVINNPSSGAASARNFGATHSKGKLLLFIDDDIIISKENIETTIKLFEQFPNSCFNLNWRYPNDLMNKLNETQFGRFLHNFNLINYKGWVKLDNWSETQIFEVNRLAAFYFSIPKTIFNSLNGFNEKFKNQGVEDDEFSQRLIDNKIKLFICPTSFVYHDESDKINLTTRLNRYKIGAFNRRQGFESGMTEYHIPYSNLKNKVYFLLSKSKKIILFFIKLIPNKIIFDKIYFKISKLLIGIYIYEGYHKID